MKIYYQKQTKQALKNFPFSIQKMPLEFVRALAEVKKAAARANRASRNLAPKIARAIEQACDEVIKGKMDEQFPVPSLQGGAGTSINMNVNEVIASRASEILKNKIEVHPNDHVNKSQSTNDVNPSALKIASIRLAKELLESTDALAEALDKKSKEYASVSKLARTHLQDAVPTTLGAEFGSYSAIVSRDQERIKHALLYLYDLNLGGTAIGNSMNASKAYQARVYAELKKITGLGVRPAGNLMSQTSSQTDFVMLSSSLVTFALDLSKIASDLRLMASGPKGGFGEIKLKELQPGSSIMPGKVNPVMPEVVNQLYYLVHGNHESIAQASRDSQLELGVMGPIIADRLIESLKLTSQVARQFAKQCVIPLKANKEACKKHLEASTAYATLLTPKLGYDAVSKAVKDAVKSNRTIREVIIEQGLLTEKAFEEITTSF